MLIYEAKYKTKKKYDQVRDYQSIDWYDDILKKFPNSLKQSKII